MTNHLKVPTSRKSTWFLDLFILTLAISLLYGIFLGSRPLMVPDEGRYSEIPREMLVTNDFITPHLNGLPYLEKPPLFYWLEALPIKLFGLNEWSLRSIPALLGLLGCLMTYLASRLLYDRRTGAFLQHYPSDERTVFHDVTHDHS